MSSDQDDVDRLLLDELEFLSKKISDLIYEQNFIDISVLNLKRIEIIKKIQNSNISNIKEKIIKIHEDNEKYIAEIESKKKELEINHSKFVNRFKAYNI